MDLDQSSPRSGLGTAPNPAREAVAAAAVQDYLQLATRENTRRSYASAVRHFEVEWGGLLPATTDGVVRYVANYGATLSANTLQLRLSALARWHVDQGFPDPTRHPTFDRLDSRTAIFCSWSKAERRRRFAPLLASFDRMYESIYAFRAGRGEHGLLSPEELAQWENKEWPDPRW